MSIPNVDFHHGLLERGTMMVVAIDTEPTLTAGNPEVVFEGDYYDGWGGRRYDLSPDGQRFLMIKADATTDDSSVSAVHEIILVQNWFAELRRLVPTN